MLGKSHFEAIDCRAAIGVVADHPRGRKNKRIRSAGSHDHPIHLFQQFSRSLLVRNGNAQSADAHPRCIVKKCFEMLAANPHRKIDGIHSNSAKRGIVNERAVAVRNRVPNHGIHIGVAFDFVVMVDIAHLRKTELSGREGSFGVKSGIGKWGPELSCQ